MGFGKGYIGHIGAMGAAMVLASSLVNTLPLEVEVQEDGGSPRPPPPPRRKSKLMDEPHIFPLNPFVSRQVRRARERRLRKLGLL